MLTLNALLTQQDFVIGLEAACFGYEEQNRPACPMSEEEIIAELRKALSSTSWRQTEGVSILYSLGFLLGEINASLAQHTKVCS